MDKRIDLFEKMPVPKAVFTLAMPTVLSMLVMVIYNMVDTYFVGQTGDHNQVAAVSIVMPVFFILMALGNIFGIGGSSLISRLLGEGETEKAKSVSSFCFYGSAAVGVVMIGVFLLGMPFIVRIIGASPNTAPFASGYLNWISLGAPFVVISAAFSNIVRSEGAAKAAMAGMMLGTVVNIVLDPILILSLEMGVEGAAIATVIGNMASAAFYFIYILKKSDVLSVLPRHFKMSDRIGSRVIFIGIPASVNNILMSATNIIINNLLVAYGDIPVAAMGIAFKANMLVVVLQIGIAMGIQPLVGYNYGAKNLTRMKAVIRFAMLCTVVIGSILTAVYIFSADGIVRAFISDEAVIQVGVPMLRALMIAGPVVGILFVFMSSFQAMDKAIPALILSVSRQGIVFIPVLFIANAVAGLGGIVYAMPIADIVSIFLAFGLFLFINRRIKEDMLATGDAERQALDSLCDEPPQA